MLHNIISFIISVGAGIVCYYICKWLDRNTEDDNQPQKD